VPSILLTAKPPENQGCLTLIEKEKASENAFYFFLWRFFLRRFFRLCLAIFARFLFLPQGI
jgi:hypothetical protein